MIEVNGLVKSFGQEKVLDSFDLSVKSGTVHALVGPNGSGKSTVIKILSTEIKPDSGDVTVLEVPISDVRQIRSLVSVVPHLSQIPDNRTTRFILESTGRSHKVPREEIEYRIMVLADMLGLGYVMDRKAGELSRGMKRRVSLALSMFNDSPVLLMDGSLAELDPGFNIKFMEILKETGDKTVLLTANNMNLIDRVCDGVTIINKGTTLLNESMSSIREKIGRPALKIKVSPLNIPRLESALRQQIFVNRISSRGDSLTVEVDNVLHIPLVIRHASTFTEIYEVKQTMASLEDLYHTFVES